MKIEVEITQEQHDCMLAGLRKNRDGSDDLTVQEWLQAALDGKVHNCMKRAHMAKFEG